MKSHLTAIVDRLNKLIETAEEEPKATFNFEKDGNVEATVTFSPADEEGPGEFAVKYAGQKEPAIFDNIDLVAIEIFYLIYDVA